MSDVRQDDRYNPVLDGIVAGSSSASHSAAFRNRRKGEDGLEARERGDLSAEVLKEREREKQMEKQTRCAYMAVPLRGRGGAVTGTVTYVHHSNIIQ